MQIVDYFLHLWLRKRSIMEFRQLSTLVPCRLFTWGEYREWTGEVSPTASGDNLSSRWECSRNIRYHSTPADRHRMTRSRYMPLEPQVSSKGLLCKFNIDERLSKVPPRSSDTTTSSSPSSANVFRGNNYLGFYLSASVDLPYLRWPETYEKKRNSLDFSSIWQWMKTVQEKVFRLLPLHHVQA